MSILSAPITLEAITAAATLDISSRTTASMSVLVSNCSTHFTIRSCLSPMCNRLTVLPSYLISRLLYSFFSYLNFSTNFNAKAGLSSGEITSLY